METTVIEKISNVARIKADYAKNSFLRCFVYSMFAGLYIGIGIALIFTLGAQVSGNEYTAGFTKLVMGASFGLALSMCILCGSDLFTGNNMLLGIGAMSGKISWLEACRVWAINLLGNLSGSLLVAFIMKFSGLLNNEQFGTFVVTMSANKINPTFAQLFFRGALCNVCVCVAVWCGQKLASEAAKLIMIWWGLFAFIGIGLEHSIANMTLLAMGILSPYASTNSDVVNWTGYASNLIPVILGNMFGGIILFSLPYYFCSTSKKKNHITLFNKSMARNVMETGLR